MKKETMITAKEKAQEIFEKIYAADDGKGNYPMLFNTAKQCALIAVDEILNAIDWHNYETPNKELDFWQEVNQEIQKL